MHLLALAVLIWELVNLQNDFIQHVTTIWLLFGESLVTKIWLFNRIFVLVCVDAKKIVGSIRLKCVAWTRQKHEVSDLIQLIPGRYFAMNTLYADHYSEMHPLIPIVTSCSVWNGLHRHAQRWNHNAFTTLQRPEGRGWTLNLMCLNQGRRREFYTYLNAGRSRTALHRNMS